MLQHLSDIARSKRVDDGNMKKTNWNDFYLQIIVNPRYAAVARSSLPLFYQNFMLLQAENQGETSYSKRSINQ